MPKFSLVLIIVVFGNWSSSQVNGEDAIAGVAPFAAAKIISGNAHERGVMYGSVFRDQIADFFKSEILKSFVNRPATREELLAYGEACGKVIRQECPMIAEELAGMADGAGLKLAEIILIHAHEELYHRQPLPMPGHCTAVAIAPAETGDGSTLVGQTWDWMQTVAGKSSILQWRRGDGPSVLAYGFPGMPFGAGMNEHGIALCWTSAALGETGKSPRVGLPSYVLIAHLLSQPDLASVIRVAKRDRHAGWFTFVMADSNGNLLNIEGSPSGIAIAQSNDRMLRVGFGSRKMTNVAAPATIKQHPRCEKRNQFLDGLNGKVTQNMLERAFADSKYQISVGKSTIDIMVFNTTTRTARVSRGPAYGEAWREFRITTHDSDSTTAR